MPGGQARLLARRLARRLMASQAHLLARACRVHAAAAVAAALAAGGAKAKPHHYARAGKAPPTSSPLLRTVSAPAGGWNGWKHLAPAAMPVAA